VDLGNVIYNYINSPVMTDGCRIEVTSIAQKAGICLPVFITRAAYEKCVAAPLDGRGQPLSGQDESSRLWDVVWMLHFAIIRSHARTGRLHFALYVRNSDQGPARLIKLIATARPVDVDDPAPPITVMLPDEDFPVL
jgi:hypothetical protein